VVVDFGLLGYLGNSWILIVWMILDLFLEGWKYLAGCFSITFHGREGIGLSFKLKSTEKNSGFFSRMVYGIKILKLNKCEYPATLVKNSCVF
jgi:hypothetical protein